VGFDLGFGVEQELGQREIGSGEIVRALVRFEM
jgi:hypothetical protein